MIALWVCTALAADGTEVPADVVQQLAHGVSINWTTLQLQLVGSARGAPAQDAKAVEQLARRHVDAAIAQTAGSIPVTASAVVDDLLAEPTLGAAMSARTSRWRVQTATYYASGRVTLDAELSLQELLKPWTLQIADPGAGPEEPPGTATGLVIDARDTSAIPAWAPSLLAPDGSVLYHGELWEEEAVTEAPYVYVTDPAHPAALRAGERPLFVVASEARGADLVLPLTDAARVRTEILEAGVLGQGRAVIVIDAD